MFISHLPAREQELFLAYFVIGGDVSEGQEHCRAVGKAQRQLPPAQDDEMRDVGSCSKPFTQGLGFACRIWGTTLASKHLGTKSSMDHPIPAPRCSHSPRAAMEQECHPEPSPTRCFTPSHLDTNSDALASSVTSSSLHSLYFFIRACCSC